MKYTLRLKNNNIFRYVLKKGKYSKCSKYLTIHFTKIKGNSNINVFGICVSKKNGNSVNRNKLKRWAREVYKQEENKLKRGYNIVLLYKKDVTISKINYKIVYDEFCNSVKEVGLYED